MYYSSMFKKKGTNENSVLPPILNSTIVPFEQTLMQRNASTDSETKLNNQFPLRDIKAVRHMHKNLSTAPIHEELIVK